RHGDSSTVSAKKPTRATNVLPAVPDIHPAGRIACRTLCTPPAQSCLRCSVVKRSHRYKHERTLDVVRCAPVRLLFEVTLAWRCSQRPHGAGQALQAQTWSVGTCV